MKIVLRSLHSLFSVEKRAAGGWRAGIGLMRSLCEMARVLNQAKACTPTSCTVVFLFLGFSVSFAQEEAPKKAELSWHSDMESAQQESKKLQRPIFLFFSAEWCNWCHVMEDQTLTKPKASTYLSENFVLLKGDYDVDRDLVAKYRIRGVPAMVVGDPEMKNVQQSTGFMPLDVFMAWIEDAASKVSPAAITAANEAAKQFVIDTSNSFRKGLTGQQYEAINEFYEKCAKRDPLSLDFAKNHLAEEVKHNPGRFCRFLKNEKLNIRIVTTNAFANLYGTEFDYDPWDLSQENADHLVAFLEKNKISSLLEDLISIEPTLPSASHRLRGPIPR